MSLGLSLVTTMVECVYAALEMKGLRISVYIKPHPKAGNGVGGITTNRRTALVHIPAALNCAYKVATILQPLVAPFMQNHPGYI
ncbi:hypothetical protein PoB_005226000 [Plakobranchus ocellatus]|uniref:Uncharacterized protein n=1 Tax=Plakobranchus ocellatus TaxID=259542 RepID=A0AAV4C2X9_9GAST|nr:hypothetical protein PoB_005226000 [Plakobranchus ocellatus]